jgi:hypothetical protein
VWTAISEEREGREVPLKDELNEILIRAGVIKNHIDDVRTTVRLIAALATKQKCYIDDLLDANQTNASNDEASAKSKYYVEDLPHMNRSLYHLSSRAISKHRCCLTFDDEILFGYLGNPQHRLKRTHPADRKRRHELRNLGRIRELDHGKSSLRHELKPEDL